MFLAFLYIATLNALNFFASLAYIGRRRTPNEVGEMFVLLILLGVEVACFWVLYDGTHIVVPMVMTVVVCLALIRGAVLIGIEPRKRYYTGGDAFACLVVNGGIIALAANML